MKIGIYGGSFNPIHYGHIGLAQWLVEHTDLDEVWLLVSPNNPLKDRTILADESIRLEKARQAVADAVAAHPLPDGKQIVVSDFEFELPRPSYTANTLRALEHAYSEHVFTLIIGEDNWHVRDKWREWDWIRANHRIFIYPRHKEGDLKPEISDPHIMYFSEAPLFDISSTEIRERQA